MKQKGESTLVDCGYTTAYSLRRLLTKQRRDILDIPDNILFTHFHGDHFAGLSALLIPMLDLVKETKRKRNLTIASALTNIQSKVERRLKEDYPGLYEEFGAAG